jgi:D-psicose/D-tagatose/L-ribulose 3-epimerase
MTTSVRAGALRLAVSNIAWPAREDDAVAEVLRDTGAAGIEVAPTMIWPEPAAVAADEVAACRARWSGRGLPIVAMQSLLFGRDHLRIFAADDTREATLSYLTSMIRLAAGLGARALVFGSPRNRALGALDAATAHQIGVRFFRALGATAAAHGVYFCIEPNPTAYGCDYLTTSTECIPLLREADSSGLGLHLDAGAMTLAGEDPEAAIAAARPWLRHFHISEPYLAPIGTGGVDHGRFAHALRRHGYDGWLSIEMKNDPAVPAVAFVGRAVSAAIMAYGSGAALTS